MPARWKVALAACAALLAIPLVAVVWLGGPRPLPPALPPSASVVDGPVVPASDEAPSDGSRLVDGFVVGEGEAPLSGASVVVEGAPSLRATSDARGHFRLRSVPLGPLTVIAEAAGHARAVVAIEPGPAGEVFELTIQLEPADPIEGTVVDPAGEPVARAIIHCLDRPEDLTLGATSDEEGHFSLPPHAAGCRAIASHKEYGDASPRVLAPGRDNRFRLGEPASIAGVVLDEGGRPLAGYMVAVESFRGEDPSRLAGPVNKRQRVDAADGRFSLEGLQAGEYVLTANVEGRPPVQSDAIRVASGEQVRGIRITVPAGAVLSGIVRDGESGDPIAGARVSLDGLTMTGPSSRPATSDDSGRYRLEGVPKGPFSVRVGKEGYLTRVEAGITTSGVGEANRDLELSPAEGDLRAEYTGIGAMLAPSTNGLRIGGVVAGGPAEKAGLERDDLILRIDGEDARSLGLPEAVQKLRGPVGSRVTVLIERDGGTQSFVITRDRFTR